MKTSSAVRQVVSAANDERPTFSERLIWRGVGQKEYGVLWAGLGASIEDIRQLAAIQSARALQLCDELGVKKP